MLQLPSITAPPRMSYAAEPDHPDLEPALMRRIRAGESAAFEQLFKQYYEPLLRFAFSYLRLRPAAEEVVQDVFLALWSRREAWDISTSLKSYLYAATRNHALNWLRRNTLERRWTASALESPDSVSIAHAVPADEGARLAELDGAVRNAIERLPPRCREAFVLSRERHLSYEEISSVMNISVKTVQEQIGRALRSLRGSLAEWIE